MTANAAANGSATIVDSRKATRTDVRIAELEAYLEDANRKLEEAQAANATASKVKHESGYKGYATKETPGAIKQFMVWLNREFPEQFPTADDEVQTRIVHLAIRTYVYYQKSDIKYATVKAAKK
jgi:chlorite dismutase